MNNIRRREIKKVISKYEILKSELESILDDERDYYENMPENLQGSMRGCDSEEAIEYMESALDCIENAIDELNNIS